MTSEKLSVKQKIREEKFGCVSHLSKGIKLMEFIIIMTVLVSKPATLPQRQAKRFTAHNRCSESQKIKVNSCYSLLLNTSL
jgi:hypothetical protein